MGIHWKLKSYLAQRHGIYRLTELQKLVSNRTGILISLSNLSKYLKEKPKALRLGTIETLCSSLDCKLSDLCEVTPKLGPKKQEVTKLSYQNTPHTKRAVAAFPDPKDYDQK